MPEVTSAEDDFEESAWEVGPGVSPPTVIYKVEPQYTEEARLAKLEGTVRLEIVVNEHGLVGRVRVLQRIGMGLDEAAIKAVKAWRFRPARKNGKPVPVVARVEVNFRLL